ncbi:MAG: hypothetical protein ABFD89_12540 [Bryobacteraceae bacterium]
MIGGISTIKPELETPFPSGRKTWRCSRTGLIVPMEEDANREYRDRLLHKAEKDSVLQADLKAAIAESPLFFLNSFVWTLHEQEVSTETWGNVPARVALHPWICFERQDELVEFLLGCFTKGHDGLVDKSRDMGCSWICAAFIHWLWLTRPNTQLRELSRVEDLVDSPISKSLFFKHDALNAYLPDWLRPPGVLVRGRENRTSMRIHNALNGSTIAGESTNSSAFSGDRAALILLDEFAKCANGESIKRSTAAVCPCRIVNSTTDLPGSCYSNWKASGTIKVFGIYAWDHPVKGKNRFLVQNETTKEYRVTSPFIEHEIERSGWKEVATEIYALEGQVGDSFFQMSDLETHAALYCREPKERFNVKLRESIPNTDVARLFRTHDLKAVQLTRAKAGELAVWAPLTKGRLDQSKSYILGIDLSKGLGGEGTSESVVSVKCKQTGEIVAKWASRTTPPYNAARVVAALCLWVGGGAPQRLPFVIWEQNGPGMDFGNVFVHELKYPYYYRDETVGNVVEKKTARWGWHSTRERKALMLRAYERALKEGRIINRDRQSLDQARTYITYPSGGCGPAELVDKDKAEYLGHGDRVIADALTVMDKSVLNPKPQAAVGSGTMHSWGGRFDAYKREQKKVNGWQKRYSFK